MGQLWKEGYRSTQEPHNLQQRQMKPRMLLLPQGQEKHNKNTPYRQAERLNHKPHEIQNVIFNPM